MMTRFFSGGGGVYLVGGCVGRGVRERQFRARARVRRARTHIRVFRGMQNRRKAKSKPKKAPYPTQVWMASQAQALMRQPTSEAALFLIQWVWCLVLLLLFVVVCWESVCLCGSVFGTCGRGGAERKAPTTKRSPGWQRGRRRRRVKCRRRRRV